MSPTVLEDLDLISCSYFAFYVIFKVVKGSLSNRAFSDSSICYSFVHHYTDHILHMVHMVHMVHIVHLLHMVHML